MKENIKAPRHWPLCGEFTGTGEFPAQRASYAENVSIWWRHNDIMVSNKQITTPGATSLINLIPVWINNHTRRNNVRYDYLSIPIATPLMLEMHMLLHHLFYHGYNDLSLLGLTLIHVSDMYSGALCFALFWIKFFLDLCDFHTPILLGCFLSLGQTLDWLSVIGSSR